MIRFVTRPSPTTHRRRCMYKVVTLAEANVSHNYTDGIACRCVNYSQFREAPLRDFSLSSSCRCHEGAFFRSQRAIKSSGCCVAVVWTCSYYVYFATCGFCGVFFISFSKSKIQHQKHTSRCFWFRSVHLDNFVACMFYVVLFPFIVIIDATIVTL